MNTTNYIILFDGECNFCSFWVKYVIRRDKKDVFRFTSLQSDLGKNIQEYLGISNPSLDTIILYIPEEAYYVKSTAALKIMKDFSGAWSLMYFFLIIPAPIRNAVYNFIAKNRYKWYGKQEICRIPTPELKAKFL